MDVVAFGHGQFVGDPSVDLNLVPVKGSGWKVETDAYLDLFARVNEEKSDLR